MSQQQWEELTLADVTEKVQYGYTTKAVKNGRLRLLRTTDITSGNVNWDKVPFCLVEPENVNKYLLEENDILISRAGSVGYSYLVKQPKLSVFASYLIRFKPKINPKYVAHFLKSPQYWSQISDKKLGIAVQNVNATKLKSLIVPVPSDAEQNKVVAKIEELLSELQNAQKNANDAEKLLPVYKLSILSAAFTGRLTNSHSDLDSSLMIEEVKKGLEDLPQLPSEWKYVKLKSLGTLGRGKSKHRPRNDPRLFGGKYPFIQTGEVKASGGIVKSYSKTYSDFGLAQSKLWPKGTLCITIAANIAETAFLDIDACFPDSVVGFKANEDLVLPEYVRHFIDLSKDRLEQFAPATAQKNINLKTLEELIIPYCSLEEQKTIIDNLERTLGYADTLRDSINNIKSQNEIARQSVLFNAYAGELL